MKLDRLSTLITALSVTATFSLLSIAEPAAAANLTGLTPTNALVNFDSDKPCFCSC